MIPDFLRARLMAEVFPTNHLVFFEDKVSVIPGQSARLNSGDQPPSLVWVSASRGQSIQLQPHRIHERRMFAPEGLRRPPYGYM